MSFWLSLLGYQAVWFAAVLGASEGLAWPGVVAMLVYALVQLVFVRNWRTDLSLMTAAFVFGFVVDGGLVSSRLASYAAGWPSATIAPAWILALWVTFALTFSQSLRYLQRRLWLAAVLGLIGGPLAYLAAGRGWQVVKFADPAWRGLLVLGVGWGLAAPALAWLARRGSARPQSASTMTHGAST